jgi:parallel beta-helix repeat protein
VSLAGRTARWPSTRASAAVAAGLWLFGAQLTLAATINVPADHATITDAIAAASSGDVIRVAPGTYIESSISFGGKNLVLESVDGPAVTIIDGNAAERVFHLTGALTRAAVIDGFTIRNGQTVTSGGGGLRILNGSPTIRNNIIESNSTSNGGGGIQVASGANPLIENNIFQNNTAAERGGALEIVGATAEVSGNAFLGNMAVANPTFSSGGAMRILSATAEVVITNNRLEGNESAFAGGALNAIASDVLLTGNMILNNESATGGGIHLETNTGAFTWTVRNNRIQNNIASSQGAGLNLFASGQAATAIIEDNEIVTNQCTNSSCSTGSEAGCCQGGGIRASQGTGVETFRGNLIQGNTADTYGGVLLLGVAPKTVVFEANRVEANVSLFLYPGVACVGVTDCTIARNELLSNANQPAPTTGVVPGGLFLKDTASARVENNFFYGNEGREAGALYALETGDPMNVVIRNNAFVDNTTLVGARGTLYLRSDPVSHHTATVVNNIFEGDVRGIYVRNSPTLDIRFNDFHGFANGVYKDGSLDLTTVASLNSQSFASSNVDVAPGLAVAGDVHLAAGSALLSAGSCADAPSVDFDGESRPLGGGCEIGADEFSVQGLIFKDGFESGDTSQWTSTVP